MSQRIIDWKTGVVQTAGAVTATVCSTDVIPNDTTVQYEVRVQGRDLASGAMASNVFMGQAKNVGGVLSLVGIPTVLVTFANGSNIALNTADAFVEISATTLRLRVTGVNLVTLEWFGDMRLEIN